MEHLCCPNGAVCQPKSPLHLPFCSGACPFAGVPTAKRMLAGGAMVRAASGPCWLRAAGGPAGLLCGLLLAACSANGPNPLSAMSALPSLTEPAPSEQKQQVKVALLVPRAGQGHTGGIGRTLNEAGGRAPCGRPN